MDGRLKSILEEALQSITTKSLESFKSKLQEKKLEGYPKIGRSNLEDTNAEKLVDLICRHYTIENAPKVIESILLEINERQAHLDLTKTLETALKDQGYGEAKAQMLDWGISDGMMKPEKDTFAIKEMNIREKTPRKGVHLDRTNHASEPSSSHHIPQTEINECENHQSVTNIDSSSNLTTENWPVHQKQKSAKKNTPWKIKLKPLTEKDIQCMKEDHQQQPGIYAQLLFKHFVSVNKLKKWAGKTNVDGSHGKRAIPANLLDAIMEQVRREFGTLNLDQKKDIKKKLNYLLNNPPKNGWPRQF